MTSRRTPIAIIGGGLSGLYVAHLLQRAGTGFQLLEARERFGGRILSVDGSGTPSSDGFDLGPSWYWPGMHPRMAGIVRELQLRDFEQYSDGDVLLERSASSPPQRFPALRQEPQSMRLVGGTGALVSALVHRLPGDRLHLASRATRITMTADSVRVSFVAGSKDHEIVADQVILALPPRLIASTLSFEPAIAGDILDLWGRTATWMAPHAKFFALYERAFWRDAGLSGTAQSGAGPLVEIHDATTASGSAALFGFIGLGRAQRLAVGEEAIVRASLAQLVRLFGPRAAEPQATLIKDWTADSLTATAADHSAAGHPTPTGGPWVSRAWSKHLSLAASETSATDPGYLAGALDAAERAANEALSWLSRGRGEKTD